MPRKHLKTNVNNAQHEPVEILHTTLELQAEKAAKHREYHEKSSPEHISHSYITKKIKSERYKQTIKQTRVGLSNIDRVFSSIIHQETIELLSEIGAKTIARPIGVLVGTIVSLSVGSFVALTGNQVGFDIPATIFAVLYIVGYLLGVLAEFLAYMVNKAIRKNDTQLK